MPATSRAPVPHSRTFGGSVGLSPKSPPPASARPASRAVSSLTRLQWPVLPRAPLDPQVYREPFFSLRRPSRSVVSRFLAHLLIRLLIVSALPGQWQAVAALFPVSMLWPLVAPPARAGAASPAPPETRVRGFEQENASCVGREASQAAGTHQAFGLGYGGGGGGRCLFPQASLYYPGGGRVIS